ncbi:MAG: glycoside hydrolase family 127 protein, partial [Acidobacteria bacterium]|nr:glycoside hydrolase family 127 protein [Acidobacteriota bacterium]
MRCAALFLLLSGAIIAQPTWRDQALLDLSRTPHARLRPVPVRAVKLNPGFWKTRQDVTIEKSIPSLLVLLEEHGILDNFRRLANRADYAPRRGPLFTDSDIYKWIEAAAWSLQVRADPQLEAALDRLIAEILSAQEPSGYHNTWFVEDREKLRFKQMTSGHELYCLGHMIQAAVAYHRSTGKRALLDGSIRFADYLLRGFGPAPKQPLLTGHPELELALAELYRLTGNRDYLRLAGYLLSGVETARLKLTPRDTAYMFSGLPFTSRTQFEGHAVRALYAATGAADYWLETGDPAYKRTLDTLWNDLAAGKIFVTGGVGSRAAGETFGDAWELPNRQAYTESCAAIAGLLFNQRMLAATGDARYAAMMERALY